MLYYVYRFQEIKKSDKVAAMQFLQTSVSELIDHSDVEQTREVTKNCINNNNLMNLFCLVWMSSVYYLYFSLVLKIFE